MLTWVKTWEHNSDQNCIVTLHSKNKWIKSACPQKTHELSTSMNFEMKELTGYILWRILKWVSFTLLWIQYLWGKSHAFPSLCPLNESTNKMFLLEKTAFYLEKSSLYVYCYIFLSCILIPFKSKTDVPSGLIFSQKDKWLFIKLIKPEGMAFITELYSLKGIGKLCRDINSHRRGQNCVHPKQTGYYLYFFQTIWNKKEIYSL